jgi:hypothetical protein
MASTRCIPALLLAALACAAHAQSSQYAPSRPSTASRASGPTVEFDEAGNPRNGAGGGGGTAAIGGEGASAAGTRAPTRPTSTQMLGAGAFGQSDGLENAVNSGTPPAWDRKSGMRKVCPPELENRNNVCVPPLGSILSR